MTTSEADGMCRQVDENMGDIIDGIAENAIFDHMAGCERCRDARYDAEQAILRLSDAALDYRMPDDLTARLMSALDARPKASSSIIPAAVGNKLATVQKLLARHDENAAGAAPSAAPSRRIEHLRRAAGSRPSARWAWLSLAAAVGLGALWIGSRRDPDAPAPSAPVGLAGAWQGQVQQVERAFGSPSGLSECARGTQVCHPLAPGDTAHPGMRLETDGLTRARVQLSDGSVIALDRQSRFELDPTERRRGRLLGGNLVAEIEKVAESAAPGAPSAPGQAVVFELPSGRVEVLGTKFSLRASEDEARVEVSRGSVTLFDARDQAVLVQAGEAGVIAGDRTPRVESVLDLGRALGWSTAAFEEKPQAAPAQGALGELIAKRPRDGRELSGAVRLKEHHIKARIVDNVARTEVEEIFENGADEVLEGIYRFPLPPGAQIERLALEVDGKLEEGAFVDRERAAAIWRGAVVNAGGKKPPPSEDIVWVPGPWRDPALLEWQRGSRFELRIFPIPARGARRIILAYTEVLPPSEGERSYVYPLPRDPRGSTRIARFTAEVQVRGLNLARGAQARGYPMKTLSGSPEVARLAFDQNDFVPSGDLSVAYELASAQAELRAWAYQPDRAGPEPPRERADRPSESLGKPGAAESRPGGTQPSGARSPAGAAPPGSDEALGIPADAPFVAMALSPRLPLRARHEPREHVLVVDTSRSMIGENYRRAIEVVTRIIREMDRGDRVSLLACDASCVPAPGASATPGDEAAAAAGRFLDSIEPEGASDLAFAVEQASALGERARAARADAAERRLRIVYVGDGTPTVGPIHPALLERAVTLALPRGASLSAVAIGSDSDRAALRTLTRAGGGISVAFTPGQSAEDVAFALLGASYGHALEHAQLTLPEGLVRVMPAQLGSIAAGAEELLVMRMTSPRVEGDVVLTGEVAGERFERHYPLALEATTGAANAFVPRLYAAVAIAELEGSLDESARRRSIELSTRFNVASRYTSLLVLESPAMFTAFGLDNRRSAPEWTGELESDKQESLAPRDELAYMIEGDSASDADPASGGLGSGSGSGSGRGSAKAIERSRAEGFGEAGREKRRASSGAADELSEEPEFARPPPDSVAPAPTARPAKPAAPGGTLQPFELPPGSAPPVEQPFELPPNEQPLRQQPFELPQRRMIPMRRVWDRIARIESPAGTLLAASPDRRQKLELRLNGNPDSRDALRSLYVFDFLAGDLDNASREAEHWSDKDPLDVDALTARADLAAQRGSRDAAIRILGSVVDVRPGDYKAQWRLARLHRWAGNPARGCRHSLAVAQLMLRDAKLVSEAVGCSREVGQSHTADALLAALEPSVRSQVEQLVQKRRPSDELSGDFRVQASWQGSEHDVDLVIVHPEGYRVSWLGAPTRAVISASDVLSVQREGLGLRGAEPGQYAIELVRSSPASGTIRGTVQLSIADAQRSLPFVLEGGRARVATVTLKNEARLVPLDAWE